MSANLRRTDCQICASAVAIDGCAPWTNKLRSEERANLRQRIQIADATCTRCGARYSAWRGYLDGDIPAGGDFVDLSFRSTFATEPGPEDLPRPAMLQELHEKEWLKFASALRAEAAELFQQAIEADDRAATGKSTWENFRINCGRGAGGTGGSSGANGGADGTAGSDGRVVITWEEVTWKR